MTSKKPLMTDDEFAERLADPVTGTDAVQDPGLVAAQIALASYRRESLHWAERRSAGQPSLHGAARRNERWAALPQWSLALVALITIAGGVAHLTINRDASQEPPSMSTEVVPQTERALSPAEIAEDNRLLSSIRAELTYHTASPVDQLGLKSRAGASAAAESSQETE